MHVLLFSRHAEEVQKFLGDVLELPSVDAGEGWPIFAAAPAEIGVHATNGEPEHEVYLMCDDIAEPCSRCRYGAECGLLRHADRKVVFLGVSALQPVL
jgi:hypothetical protein